MPLAGRASAREKKTKTKLINSEEKKINQQLPLR